MPQARRQNQEVVVGKMPPPVPGVAEVLQSPISARELSCCWQAELRQARRAKSALRNALGPELRCCWQDRTTAASGPVTSVAGGCFPPRRGASRDTVSNNRDCGRATCAGCPGRPRDIRGRRRSFLGGSRYAVVAGNQARRIPVGGAGTSTAESPSGNNGNAFHPYGRCRITPDPRFRNWCRVPYRVPANGLSSTT